MADILIEGEKIKEVGVGLRGDEIFNLRGKLVIPGVIDLHVHMRDFSQKYKEDFTSGSKAALAGGVTTFVDMPNSSPPVIDAKTFRRRLEEAGRKSLIDFGINFGVVTDNSRFLKDIRPSFCKIYMDGTLGEIDDETLRNAIRRCPKTAVHAEDINVIKENIEKFKGKEVSDFHLKIRGPEAEEKAIKKIASLTASLNKSVHICHISLRKSLEYLNENVTCEVTPHHLLLTNKELKEKGGIAKTNPPLRSQSDTNALMGALKNRRIDIVASDHAPHLEDEKEDEVSAPPGIPNLDIMLKLFLTLVNKKVLTLSDIVRTMCENPARLLGLKKGEIKKDNYADLVILDLEKESKIEVEEFYSKAKYSPFEGWRTKGCPEVVFIRGEIAFEDEDFIVKRGYGKWIGGM
jgi:dihydroorotase